MIFIADEMLGKLARWLRMSGFDVLYFRQVSDEELIQKARNEGRILLTRDTRLIQRLAPNEYLFITQDHLQEQFLEFFRHFPDLSQDQHPFSRCAECNTPLEPIEKEKVRGKVWPFVFKTQDHFTLCPTCRRIYWEATHVRQIRQKLQFLTRSVADF